MSTVESDGNSWHHKGSLYSFPSHPEARTFKSKVIDSIDISPSNSEDVPHFVLPPKPQFLTDHQKSKNIEEEALQESLEGTEDTTTYHTSKIERFIRSKVLHYAVGFLGLAGVVNQAKQIFTQNTPPTPLRLSIYAGEMGTAPLPITDPVEQPTVLPVEIPPTEEVINADTYIIGDEKDPETGEGFNFAEVAGDYANDKFLWKIIKMC